MSIEAQTKPPKQTTTKVQAQPPVQAQIEKETPNPYALIDEKALQIPDSLTKSPDGIASFIQTHFSSNSEKVRAAFIWVAGNIRYDVVNMYSINYYEKLEDKIAKPLQTRQGICENYAALFAAICQKLGMESFFVGGYVRFYGKVSDLPHAWCATKVDSTWYLFDPTWASGGLTNGVFIPKIDNKWYKTSPSVNIKTHMPYDPIWQLLDHPLSYDEFNTGKENNLTPVFNFSDSIAVYFKQDSEDRDKAAYTRIDRNGTKNSLIFNMLQYLRQTIEQEKFKHYNLAVARYNDAIYNYNDFIRYRNKQFNPLKSDVDIQAMLDSAAIPLQDAKLQLSKIKEPGGELVNAMSTMQRQMLDYSTQLEEQQTWLAKYFTKGKSGRRSMFYTRISLFGSSKN